MKKNIYLFKSGELKQENKTINYIIKNESQFLPIEQVEHIHVFGEMKLNKRILQLCSKYKINITFYTRYGNIIGRFVNTSYRIGKNIIEQTKTYLDTLKCNKIIYKIILASSRNCLSLLKYYKKEGFDLENIIINIESEIERFKTINTKSVNYREVAMLFEARIKQKYYKLFDVILKNSDFEFVERINNPPGNEFNAMMSFGYSLLYGDLLNSIEKSNLIPEISFIHGHSRHTSGSLQYDLADIFKPHIIDRLCLRMVRSNLIKLENFYKTSSGGIFLDEEGRRIFVREYDKQLNKTVKDIRNNRSYSYKQFLSREVYKLSDFVIKGYEYTPVYFKW